MAAFAGLPRKIQRAEARRANRFRLVVFMASPVNSRQQRADGIYRSYAVLLAGEGIEQPAHDEPRLICDLLVSSARHAHESGFLGGALHDRIIRREKNPIRNIPT